MIYMEYWFWAFVIELFMLYIFIGRDNGFFAFLSLIIYGLVLQFLLGIDCYQYFMDNWVLLVMYVPAYLVTGAFWSILVWTSYILDERQKLTENLITPMIEVVEPFIARAMHEHAYKNEIIKWISYWPASIMIKEFSPQIVNYKDDIARWIFFWPIHFIWTIVHGWINGRISNSAKNTFYAIYQNITDKLYLDQCIRKNFK